MLQSALLQRLHSLSQLLKSHSGGLRTRQTATSTTPRICIVGSGPAGFYAAQHILKQLPHCRIDMLERLPVPFGLVRYGVAPDHPEVKNVINTFTKTAESNGARFQFYGNVSLGRDLSLQQLRGSYHAILLAYGADRDRPLELSSSVSQSRVVISAREFVAWYNGLPGSEGLKPDLSRTKSVAIVGQGNVALDVARILLSPIESLKSTDITAHALDSLSSSKVQRVYLIGRRGPLQVAFTIKELREILRLPGVTTRWRTQDFVGVSDLVEKLGRPRKRLTELMLKSLNEQEEKNRQDQQDQGQTTKTEFFPIFLRSPHTFEHNSLTCTVNVLKEENALATAETEVIPADLVLSSIGYTSTCVDKDISFDGRRGRVANEKGRVLQTSGGVDRGLYVAGWLGTGPTGVILTTMNNAFAVANILCEDIKDGSVDTQRQLIDIDTYIKNSIETVSWQHWKRIDEEEVRRGQLVGKPREKILCVDEMLKVAKPTVSITEAL